MSKRHFGSVRRFHPGGIRRATGTRVGISPSRHSRRRATAGSLASIETDLHRARGLTRAGK